MKLGVYIEPNGRLLEVDRWSGYYYVYDRQKLVIIVFHNREKEWEHYLKICKYKGKL
jgi:hypothetical protein